MINPKARTSAERFDYTEQELDGAAQKELTASERNPFFRAIAWLAKAMAVLLVLGGIGWFYSVHNDFYRRVNASEALAFGLTAVAPGGRNFAYTGRLPESIEDLDIEQDGNAYVKAIKVDPANGVVRITVAGAPKGEDALELVPSLTAEGQLAYTCRSVNVPEKFAPAICRP